MSPPSTDSVSEVAVATPVVLVGLMGSGKTTVGNLVADRLGLPFADTDHLVEVAAGRTVAEVFAYEHEAGFRARESAALVAALARPQVVATGGGAVLIDLNRRVIRSAPVVVWLAAPPEVLASRLAGDAGDERPLLAAGSASVVETLHRLSAERALFYREVADHVIEVADRSPEEVADEIVGLARAAERT